MKHTLPATAEQFLQQTIEKLGVYPCDFSENFAMIQRASATSRPYKAAGVLVLLFHPQTKGTEKDGGEFYFRLIERSRRVSQAGDLACPGGIFQATLDTCLGKLIKSGLLPLLRNSAGALAREREGDTYDLIAFFLANAAREAWEEIGLNPFRIRFLGPLPAYRLHLSERTIFPLVCFIPGDHRLRPNYEVERIVDIPVRAFFDAGNYGRIIPEIPPGLDLPESESRAKPCLIYSDEQSRENILWGATFSIVTRFLKIVLAYDIPAWQNKRSVIKTLNRDYLAGNNNSI